MMSELPHRLWLPLLILKTTGELTAKTKFQKIAFLTQYESKIDDYDFRKHHYGPYSDILALDTSCYPSLIEETMHPSFHSNGHYYKYALTEKGDIQLSELIKNVDSDTVKAVIENINKFKDMTTCQLLEEVYSKFALNQEDSVKLAQEVSVELEKVMPPIMNCYSNYHNRQATFVLAILETTSKIFATANKIEDTVQRGVIFNVSKEIIHRCKEVGKEIAPPSNTDFLRPIFLDIHEQIQFLTEYCDTRKIMQNPYLQPLEEIMSEDEALRLAKELAEVKIPA